MMNVKKTATGIGVVFVILCALYLLAGRSLRELFGYVRATAGTTVQEIEANVPQAIHDQKLKNDIDQARNEIVDRRVKLNLAHTEIRQMQEEIDTLAARVKRRESILAEAYPALEAAAKNRMQKVSFAGTEWQPNDLGAEVDRLMLEQERDERQLAIRKEAIDRLVKSVDEGAAAIAQMESKLLEAENEFQTLVVRREQAENESELLDLVASAGRTGSTAAAQISTGIEKLRGDVSRLEAKNEARRETAPVGDQQPSRLTQAWERLERLKALNEKHRAAESESRSAENAAPEPPKGETAGETAATASGVKAQESKSAGSDVIIVIKDAAVQPMEQARPQNADSTTAPVQE
jgi:chromosome segregation ATPase